MRDQDLIKEQIVAKHEEVEMVTMCLQGLTVILHKIDSNNEAPYYAKVMAHSYLEQMQDKHDKAKAELIELLRAL
jgi:hypothetical protein